MTRNSVLWRKSVALQLFATACIVLVIVVFGGSDRVQAQRPELPCIPPPWSPSRVILLLERIAQSDRWDTARGHIVTREATFVLNGDEKVCFSSTQDGLGRLKADDELDFSVERSDQTPAGWKKDFYDPNAHGIGTPGITDMPPQDVSSLFLRGQNKVKVELNDFQPPFYSAEPVFIVIWLAPTPLPPTATHTPRPSPTPYPTQPSPTAYPTQPSPTAYPTQPSPTAYPTQPSPTAYPTQLPVPTAQLLVDVKSVDFPSEIEQGQPFTVSVDIVTRVTISTMAVSGTVRNARDKIADPIQEGIVFVQRPSGNWLGPISPISQAGTYSLTVHIEGKKPDGENFGKDGSQDQIEGFQVLEPCWPWRCGLPIAGGALGLGILALGVVGGIRWHDDSLKRTPLGTLAQTNAAERTKRPDGKLNTMRLDEYSPSKVVSLIRDNIDKRLLLTPGQTSDALARFLGRYAQEKDPPVKTYVVGVQSAEGVRLGDSTETLRPGQETELIEGDKLHIGDDELEYHEQASVD